MLNVILTLNFVFALVATTVLKLLEYRMIIELKRYLLVSFVVLAIYHLYISFHYY